MRWIRWIRWFPWLMLASALGCGTRAVPPAAVPAAVPAPVVTAEAPARREPLAAESNPEDAWAARDSVDQGDPTFWQQAETMFSQAKEAGETTAANTTEWIGEMVGAASDGTQTATQNATTWLSEKYQEAKRQGETSASSAKDWVSDDLGKVGTWQYKVLTLEDPTQAEAELNALGAARWECFETQGSTFYLKRPHRSVLRQLPAKDLLRLLPLLQFGGADEVAP